MTEKTKRKTHTSSEVIARYQKKTYKRYSIVLRKVEDAELIAFFEENKENSISPSDTVRALFKNK